MCAKAEITLSIVETIAIYMVNNQTFRGMHNPAVHTNPMPFSAYTAKGVKSVSILLTAPFVFYEVLVIIGVDYCESSVR
jgi:hypothetical protein